MKEKERKGEKGKEGKSYYKGEIQVISSIEHSFHNSGRRGKKGRGRKA